MDPHSYSNPELVRVRHIELDLEVCFDRRIIQATATLHFAAVQTRELVLDTRGLRIEKVEGPDGSRPFDLGAEDPVLGSALRIALEPGDTQVTVVYATGPGASALQWLEPAQTAGKQYPFLYTQSQAIHARSWIPLQDTPGVRVTYSARVRTPDSLRAVMSAEMRPGKPGEYFFEMAQPIPSYLIALAVGELAFRPLGPRTGVYATSSIIDHAASEFVDTEAMIAAVEHLYGPYRWGRYDLLVLPPSFPFGGMENPRLTFVTPTMIAGDRSLVALVAHELAHSWSGNLVTNATWEDFWLNEGFTVYLERRIMELVFGERRARMEAFLGKRELEREMASLPPGDTILHIDLKGRDPDAGCTLVPYEKGALFLQLLEERVGRERFDAFLRQYFQEFSFQSITTEQFVAYLKKTLPIDDIPWEEWLTQPGLPESAPEPLCDAFERVDAQAGVPAGEIDAAGWSTHEWLHFLRALPSPLGADRMRELDAAFHFTGSGNAEILEEWLRLAIQNRYEPAEGRLESFLVSVGRRKFLKPLYEELVRTPEGRARAREIYQRARPGYHPIAQATLDSLVNSPEGRC